MIYKLNIQPFILDEDFHRHVGTRNRTKTKAAEVEHAVRHHLDVELDDDPDLQASFAEALARIFQDFRDNWDRIYKELEKLRARIIDASKEPTYGLHRKKQMPFFRMLRREIFGTNNVSESGAVDSSAISEEDKISALVNLTQHIFLAIERELRLAGFWGSIPARNKLKAEVQKILLAEDFSELPGIVRNRAHLISRIMEIAEKNNDIILYADEQQ